MIEEEFHYGYVVAEACHVKAGLSVEAVRLEKECLPAFLDERFHNFTMPICTRHIEAGASVAINLEEKRLTA
jgi:hypothetical protein